MVRLLRASTTRCFETPSGPSRLCCGPAGSGRRGPPCGTGMPCRRLSAWLSRSHGRREGALDRSQLAPGGPPESPALVTAAAAAIVGGAIVAALYVARDIFVPLALAVLLSFVIAPLARALQA